MRIDTIPTINKLFFIHTRECERWGNLDLEQVTYICVHLLSYCRQGMFEHSQIIPWYLSLTEKSGYWRTVLSTLWPLVYLVQNYVLYGSEGISPSQLHSNCGELIWFPIVLRKKLPSTWIPSRYRTWQLTETWHIWWGSHQEAYWCVGKYMSTNHITIGVCCRYTGTWYSGHQHHLPISII